MPFNPADYPADWPAIRQRILARSGDRCECAGLCGDDHGGQRCPEVNGQAARWGENQLQLAGVPPVSRAVVVLTTAHLDHDTTHNDPSNLAALCQRCHLRLDRVQHAESAARTRLERESLPLPGQRSLLEAM